MGQLTGATTGEPSTPSPTSGSSPRSLIPTFFGQPGSNALEWHRPPEQVIAPPVALIAYTRPLANWSTPRAPIAPTAAEVSEPASSPPSSPVLTAYSSLVPTTISGLPPTEATAGVSTILP